MPAKRSPVVLIFISYSTDGIVWGGQTGTTDGSDSAGVSAVVVDKLGNSVEEDEAPVAAKSDPVVVTTVVLDCSAASVEVGSVEN